MPELYPHQVTGVDWLAGCRRGMLLDEMGLGKTITAIVSADEADARRVLCVVPAVVLWNWKREWERWSPARQVTVIDRGWAQGPSCPVFFFLEADVVVTTHSLLLNKAVRRQLFDRRWDLLIVDEVHFFRTPSAKRTRSLYARTGGRCLVDCADRIWALTGTPMPNHAGELWTHLHGLFPERLVRRGTEKCYDMTYEQFMDHFCVSEPVYVGGRRVDDKVVANKNVAELRLMLKDISLRRLKRDVMRDLPPVRYEVVVLQPEVVSSELAKLDKDYRASYSGGYDLADVAGLRGTEEFARWRRLCGLAKAPATVEMLRAELEFGALDKVAVFAWHRDVLDELHRGLADYCPVMIHGGTPLKERAANVDLFQNGDVRVAVCQLVAGGTGITLTAASEVVVVEASFVPGENAQAVGRCHRIGQEARVRARFVALAGTVDEDVTRVLRRKVAMIREVLR
jgi:SNF2 family DNA or RNA helicase